MGILDRLHKKLSPSRYPPDFFPSVVVLLAEPLLLNMEQVHARAQQAWGKAGNATIIGTLQNGASHVIQCGPLTFSVHCVNARYGGGTSGGSEILQRPWNDHKAWLAVDMPQQRNDELHRSGSLGEIYRLLLVFVFLSWSNQCLAVYFPAEGITIPNFGDLAGNIQWGRRAGLDLSFLN